MNPLDPYAQMVLVAKKFFLAARIHINVEEYAQEFKQMLQNQWTSQEHGLSPQEEFDQEPDTFGYFINSFCMDIGELFTNLDHGGFGWGSELEDQIAPLAATALGVELP